MPLVSRMPFVWRLSLVARPAAVAAISLTVLAALAVAGLAAGPASAKVKKCSTGGVTLAAGEQSRVFSKAKAEDDPVYACRYKTGKKVKLGTYRNCSDFVSVGLFRLAGPYVAFESESCDLVAGKGSVKLVDLRTGVTKFSKQAAPVPPMSDEPDYGVRASSSGPTARWPGSVGTRTPAALRTRTTSSRRRPRHSTRAPVSPADRWP